MNYNITNLVSAIVLSVGIIFGWQYFYEKPKLAQLTAKHKLYNQQIANTKLSEIKLTPAISRTEALGEAKRIRIKSLTLSGSIALKGLRFDDLTLLQYKQDLSSDSKAVELFSPANSDKAYFAEIGWFGQKDNSLPNIDTQWQTDAELLTPESPVNLAWTNDHGIKFVINITLDHDYMFTIKQTIINGSKELINAQSYGLVNHNYHQKEKSVNILHQGPIGVVNNQLKEYSYDDIKDKKIEKFPDAKINWIGVTDKYWLVAFIPDQESLYSSNISYAIKSGHEKFQTDFLSNHQNVEPGCELTVTHRLFAGAKKVDLLDKYEKQYNIKLFDRAIDFGWFYILTKPLFYAMNFFYSYVGNFGISILIVTVMVKLLMFTLANKSYRSMQKMKSIQPEMERIKNLYSEDKTRLNQEIVQLYKKEGVNPVAGCLPIIIQIPVFFSIYKVLYVTIEMRHAPFFGWIKDLSSPDPTSIFNLFGLISYSPPSFLMIGAWPIFMAITMFLQQKMGPTPADPVQAQLMKFMPLLFLVMFSSFPAGLLIYWSWNNILSIVQQYSINKMANSRQHNMSNA
ncbi:MAG: membrane protein insertase YidC [Rickettsiaceae bacterium]|nr:MAG: membrane protein insertase YidC [Rickettsiaceae bacterium]